MVGKWHLGHADKKFWPQNRGFDYFYGNVMGEVNYFTRERGGVIDWQRNGKFMKEEGYYTTLIGDEAVKLIEQAGSASPSSSTSPRLRRMRPIRCPTSTSSATLTSRTSSAATYCGDDHRARRPGGPIVAALDKKRLARQHAHPVLQRQWRRDQRHVRQRLEEQGRAGARGRRHRAGGQGAGLQRRFRGGKGSLYEGGVRVPAIRQLAGEAEARVVNEPLHMVDIMPTAARPGRRQGQPGSSDGRQEHLGRCWPTEAVAERGHPDQRRGVSRRRPQGRLEAHEVALLPGKTELFNLANDPGEKNNVADQHPEVVRDLEARLLAYARQQKPSEWIKAQPAFVGEQGKTVFDPDFDIDDGGLPHEKAVAAGEVAHESTSGKKRQ